MGRLDSKVGLITGAASGLGKAMAQRFKAEGARVFIADINRDLGEQVSAELGAGVEFLYLDVADADSWQRCFSAIKEQSEQLDILVNSAAILVFDNIETATLEQWERVQKINGTGMFLGCKYGVEMMKERTKAGSIINLSSAGSERSSPENLSYCASKALVRNLTITVALHCANQGYPIRCNSLHPGVVDTPMIRGDVKGKELDVMMAAFADVHPMGRTATVADIVGAAVYMASDESAFMTGSPLIVDGGYTRA